MTGRVRQHPANCTSLNEPAVTPTLLRASEPPLCPLFTPFTLSLQFRAPINRDDMLSYKIRSSFRRWPQSQFYISSSRGKYRSEKKDSLPKIIALGNFRMTLAQSLAYDRVIRRSNWEELPRITLHMLGGCCSSSNLLSGSIEASFRIVTMKAVHDV